MPVWRAAWAANISASRFRLQLRAKGGPVIELARGHGHNALQHLGVGGCSLEVTLEAHGHEAQAGMTVRCTGIKGHAAIPREHLA